MHHAGGSLPRHRKNAAVLGIGGVFFQCAVSAEVHAQKKYLDLPAHAAVNAPGQART
jgi:hypothetical protein